MYERVCSEQETNTSKIKETVDTFNYYINELRSTNRDMQTYIDSCKKESERRAAYMDQNAAHFKNIAKITIDSASVITHEKQNVREEDPNILYEKKYADKSMHASEIIGQTLAKKLDKTQA